MLKDLLESHKCFKLVCAAGNEDSLEIEKLVTLYSEAGCKFFDLCAKPEVVESAKKALGTKEGYICVSVGTKDDPHVRKAHIKENCIKCKKCIGVCPQNAITQNFKIIESRCIGCAKCKNICEQNAIKFTDKSRNLEEILPPLINAGIDCIELHSSSEAEIYEKWNYINQVFHGFLSICIHSTQINESKLIEIIKKMLLSRRPFTTIIKAEGASMAGSLDDFNTTIKTIEIAEMLSKENLPAYIFLSGGTNIKSTQITKKRKIKIDGVAIGTYARNIIQEYTNQKDFLTNKEIYKKALEKAENLVKTSLQYL